MKFQYLAGFVCVVLLISASGIFLFENRETVKTSIAEKNFNAISFLLKQKITDLGKATASNSNEITGGVVASEGPKFSAVSFSYQTLENFSLYIIMLTALIAVIFFVAGFSAKLNEDNDSRQMLVQYIKIAKENDFKKDEIKQRLSKAGWTDDKTGKAFNRVHFDEDGNHNSAESSE